MTRRPERDTRTTRAAARTALAGAVLALAGLALGAARGHAPAGERTTSLEERFPDALATIREDEIEAAVRYLASPELEGRDTPSRGLELAQQYVVRRFEAAGLAPSADSREAWKRAMGATAPPAWAEHAGGGVWLRPYLRSKLLFDRLELQSPVEAECSLEARTGNETRALRYGADFVPLDGYTGEAKGELTFAGFGIESVSERYDDLKGVEVKGKVVAIVAGEPDHKRLFAGPDVTAEASVWNKIDLLAREGAAAVLVVRRPPPLEKGERAPELSYRWTRASWMAPTNDKLRTIVPAVELHWEAAAGLLGFDPLEWAERVERSGKPQRRSVPKLEIALRSTTRPGPVALYNVVGVVAGEDEALAKECVVVGAHADHIGVGPRERVGRGADDNASGTAAMIEVAEAIAADPPARTTVFAAFSAEEDGLLGSAAMAADLPVPKADVVAMVNLDMIGRGDANHVVVLGFRQNPGLQAVVARAQKHARTGVTRVEDCRDAELFKRSDHYSFHEVGIPVVFFFENYPLEQNKDYHTWRDLPDDVDFEKVRNTARLAYSTVWLLATDATRVGPPER